MPVPPSFHRSPHPFASLWLISHIQPPRNMYCVNKDSVQDMTSLLKIRSMDTTVIITLHLSGALSCSECYESCHYKFIYEYHLIWQKCHFWFTCTIADFWVGYFYFLISFVPLFPQGFMGPVQPVMWDFSRTGISRENLPRPQCLCSSRGQPLRPVFWGGEMREGRVWGVLPHLILLHYRTFSPSVSVSLSPSLKS